MNMYSWTAPHPGRRAADSEYLPKVNAGPGSGFEGQGWSEPPIRSSIPDLGLGDRPKMSFWALLWQKEIAKNFGSEVESELTQGLVRTPVVEAAGGGGAGWTPPVQERGWIPPSQPHAPYRPLQGMLIRHQ